MYFVLEFNSEEFFFELRVLDLFMLIVIFEYLCIFSMVFSKCIILIMISF